MLWKQWTKKSENIAFKSCKNGVGDGEEKVAHELESIVLGQNSTYDLHIDGINYEVKKLDKKNDFNTAKKGRSVLRPILKDIDGLLDSLHELGLLKEYKELLKPIENVYSDELAVGTIRKLISVVEILNEKLLKLLELIPTELFYQKEDEKPLSIRLDLYFRICKETKQDFPEKYVSLEPIMKIIQLMNNKYIQEPDLLNKDLDTLPVNFLKDVSLIIVDKHKGYMFIDDISKVKFLRITRGNPRFQIIDSNI